VTHVAIVGATGAVGRRLMSELEPFAGRVGKLSLFASERSAGQELPFCGDPLRVQAYSAEHMRGVDYVLMSAGGAFSRRHAPEMVAAGAVVIDNSSAWRMASDVDLVVPEVNGNVTLSRRGPRIIANPNCSTIQLVLCLKPIADRFGLKSVVVSSYQSVSGAGQQGMTDLLQQTRAHLAGERVVPEKLPKPIAFDLIPAIDTLDAQGHCFEEVKIVLESRKILGMPELDVIATTVRVPTLVGHGESVLLETKRSVTVQDLMSTWEQAPSVEVSEAADYSQLPGLSVCRDQREVYISRVRLPHGATSSNRCMFWNVADNLMVGAATNAVRILALLMGS
jgi:aspartate-semialdehyde dehydrogenase